jgi:WD40 repeat protein
VSGSCDRTVRIWELDTAGNYQCVEILNDVADEHQILALQVLADGRIISGDSNGSVKIWDGMKVV